MKPQVCLIVCADRLIGYGDTLEDAIRDFADLYRIPYDRAREAVAKRDVLIAYAIQDASDLADDDGIMREDWLHDPRIVRFHHGELLK